MAKAKVQDLQWDLMRSMAPATRVRAVSGEGDIRAPNGATLYVGTKGSVEFQPYKGSEFVTVPNLEGFVPIRVYAVRLGSDTSATEIFFVW